MIDDLKRKPGRKPKWRQMFDGKTHLVDGLGDADEARKVKHNIQRAAGHAGVRVRIQAGLNRKWALDGGRVRHVEGWALAVRKMGDV